ncbi:PE-PGRS family protein [Streptomyces albidoflavus]
MRTVNPQDLEQLAKLLDGRGGLQDKLDEAFTRASSLGVTSKLSTLRPLRSWVSDTAPDLRKRATFARLEDGDPEAGLRWAGFTERELAKLRREGLSPDQILLANSVAASGDPNADTYKREPNESLKDWLTRLEAGALAQIPGLAPHEETIASLIKYAGDAGSVIKATGVVTVQGTALTKVLVGNALKRNYVTPWKNRIATALSSSRFTALQGAGSRLAAWSPKIRQLSAPGAWLPGQLGALFQRSSLYQSVTRIPLTTGVRGDILGSAYNWARGTRAAQALHVNGVINFVVGNDALAEARGLGARAGQVNLARAGSSFYNTARTAGAGRLSSLGSALSGASKVGGFLRGAGVAGGVISTGTSVANVVSQGNPVDAFKRNGAGYVADVAEVGFNASLTAAMVAPNPVTIGAAVVTGAIYGGAKVVENWDDIKAGAGKAADWVADKSDKLVDGAKDLAKKADPRNWF